MLDDCDGILFLGGWGYQDPYRRVYYKGVGGLMMR